MASTKTECPKCFSPKNVRLRSDTMTALNYWCSSCRVPFSIPKIMRKPKK